MVDIAELLRDMAVGPPADASALSPSSVGTSQTASVLIVDDDRTVARVLGSLLQRRGYAVRLAHDGAEALAAVNDSRPDVVLLDVVLPEVNGYELCRRLRHDPATRLLPIILVTGLAEPAQRVEGLESGADDVLTKPVYPAELIARVGSLVRMKRYTDDLDSAASIIMTLADMIETRDGYTHGHCHRMANYATAFGRRLGLGEDDLQALHRGGFLHDMGMLAIPDGVLKKETQLSPEEYELIKSHTVIGDTMCGNLRSLSSVRPIVRHHHEKLDGSGYPDGLTGDGIPLLAQIMGIVDLYDAVTTSRPYQDAKPTEAAVDILRRQVECGWRRQDLAEEFIAMVRGATFVAA
jgi:putative two-component system response regulator